MLSIRQAFAFQADAFQLCTGCMTLMSKSHDAR